MTTERTVKKARPQDLRSIAVRLANYLAPRGLFHDVRIYAGGKLYSSEKAEPKSAKRRTQHRHEYWLTEGIDPAEFVSTSDKPYLRKTIAMTFEGPLYEHLNYKDFELLFEMTDLYLAEYGMYFELENSYTAIAYRA